MLTLQQVHYYYHQDLFAFDLEVEAGSIVALMGPSGAGKSTLLALLAGFIAPQSGRMALDGRLLNTLSPAQRPFSMLFQEHNLFAHLTVRDNIALGLHPGLKLTSQQQKQVEQAAKQVGIEAYLDRLPEQLSGGQRQRVALARCFVQPNPIWLLDEPFSALDPVLREEMLSLVKLLAQERAITVLMVTHHLSDARAIASHFAYIDKGTIAAHGPIASLNEKHSHPELVEFFQAAV
ncbi:TPA: thiamine ABC transporter ATP-binding protein [Vibrio vulnificus]|uniref:thiamine ABC transporter ATP-binding protein n=1 Tax=Vibrio TaxID=662 RepID=UPI001A2BBB19|nr:MULTISPECIES: thiamine ABC transporter ATP-binding protein [Vibrio]EIO3979422.1 thiamine ABC transporter ATP-binding protein [Vibrio vulnificus]EIU7747159.1 thiamine ABC transporter ATP-binding protein [Vibrio vulnificus]EJN6716289.1 thiamine ABC transporter ATP-binding protein [Vibrio vulnificus]EJQ9992313.1 thiamine ABC transporter ATP-binding protein [Vibrio vulnificus]ELB7529198.1 thiamine ABC transporter ATP-binding protein [Vibrio vulnificus]